MVDRRARAGETRALLLDAAARVFEERGYRATSVAAITKEAATAHGTFYIYFRNKEDVFAEVVQGLIVELYEHSFTSVDAADGGLGVDRSRQRIAGFLEEFAARAGLWRALLEAALQSPMVAARRQGSRQKLIDRLAEGLEALVEAGVAADLDAGAAAEALGSMLEWTALRGLVFVDPEARLVDDEGRARPELVDALTAVWLRAVTG